jgi:hypothetical protein
LQNFEIIAVRTARHNPEQVGRLLIAAGSFRN